MKKIKKNNGQVKKRFFIWKVVTLNVLIGLIISSFAPFAVALQTSAGFYGDTSSSFYSSTTNTWQTSRPTIDSIYGGLAGDYWPILTNLEKDQCEAVSSDFVIAIPPLGCSPAVVRSDLLAEQNVPVFCQLSAIRVNPLIDVSSIKSISFKGDYPEGVAGISFHPARAAVNSYRTLLGDPIEENIGYVVIVLKRQPDERNLEEQISGMLTAVIRYDAKGAFGTGAGEYYLEPVSDSEWETKAAASSFWGGKGYLRVTNIDSNSATIEVRTSKEDVYRTLDLKEGETSSLVYYPGYYCTAALSVRLNKIDNSEDMARIDVDGDVYWVREGSRILDSKCRITDLNVFPGGTGEVEISCSGNSKFQLVLGDKGVLFNIKNKEGKTEEINALIGSEIKTGSNSYYLGYYGKIPSGVSDKGDKESFAVLFKKKLNEEAVSYITSVYENEADNFNKLDDLEKALQGLNDYGIKEYDVLYDSDEINEIKFLGLNNEKSAGRYADSSNVPKYLDLARDVTKELIDNFPAEKKANEEYWGEEALYKQIMLAKEAGNEEMQIDLIDLFLKTYPESKSYNYLRDMKTDLDKFEFGEASRNVVINNENYNIRVDGFVSGTEYDESVDLRIDGGQILQLKNGKTYDLGGKEITDEKEKKEQVPRLVVTDIDGASARFSYVYWKDDDKKSSTSSSFSLKEGEYENVGRVQFKVEETNVHEVAYVKLTPKVLNTKTEANFTFNIGVEERALAISPEEARKKANELNKSIEKWEERLDKLGNIIKGFKGACFAVSAVLMLKSMFTGFSGESLARSKIMDIYEEKCRKEGAKTSTELQACYSKYSTEIETETGKYAGGIGGVNSDVKCAEVEGIVSTEFLESEVIDSERYVNKVKECVASIKDWNGYKIGDVEITKNDLKDASDIQAVLLYEKLDCDGTGKGSVACQVAKSEMEKALSDNVEMIKESNLAKLLNVEVEDIYKDNTNAKQVSVSQISDENGKSVAGVSLKKGDYYKVVQSGNNEYVYVLNKRTTGSFEVTSIYKSGSKISGNEFENLANKYNFISTKSSTSCSNKMIKPYVRYYESLNKQGFAGIVPFDTNKGWYAYVEKGDYSESGVANAFWICNVGTDGLIGEGTKGGDDCQKYSTSAGAVEFIPCKLSSTESKKLYNEAERKIREANQNKNGVTVGGNFISKINPMSSSTNNLECTDFMSVDDCNLMFNVCDPVLCPSSRCDLGGTFPVADVVQTGIIGSIALCLPNFGSPSEGGVLIPVCLSGIHAGIDAYVNILKSHRDCLEQNIKNGEYVGICDEITSVYTCEFFWGQFSPILDTLLQRFVESLYTGFQTKGGAEYLTVTKAFENLDNSIEYFTSTYAKNTFRAFQLKNVDEIGSSVCKAFIGSSIPTSADALDSLLEPESPTQFYAYFSESSYSEATVPATSHYKVYYHIYAGKDFGAQYRVYLKNPPQSSYYSSRQTLLVDSGYVSVGNNADEAIDFTAPSGYKELCVSINGQDECGFGSVTSNFALNYASQAYIAEQADDKAITKTEDCVTTSTSGWGLVSPNIQAGVETVIGGEDIANSGIIRVCASSNPEEGVVAGNDVYCKVSEDKDTNGDGKMDSNPRCGAGYHCVASIADAETKSDVGVCKNDAGTKQVSMGKWVDVGYCDEPNVRCWLDSTSVEKNLDLYMAVNNITSASEILLESESLTELKGEYESVRKNLDTQKNLIESLSKEELLAGDSNEKIKEIIENLKKIIGLEREHTGQGTNADKAEALALKASVYRTIVEAIIATNPELRFEEQTLNSAPVDKVECTFDVDCRLNDEFGVFYECKDNKCVWAGGGEEVADEGALLFGGESPLEKGDVIPVKNSDTNKEYYVKYDTKAWYDLFPEWYFSLDGTKWNEVLQNNAVFNFLFKKNLEEGAEALESQPNIEIVGEDIEISRVPSGVSFAESSLSVQTTVLSIADGFRKDYKITVQNEADFLDLIAINIDLDNGELRKLIESETNYEDGSVKYPKTLEYEFKDVKKSSYIIIWSDETYSVSPIQEDFHFKDGKWFEGEVDEYDEYELEEFEGLDYAGGIRKITSEVLNEKIIPTTKRRWDYVYVYNIDKVPFISRDIPHYKNVISQFSVSELLDNEEKIRELAEKAVLD